MKPHGCLWPLSIPYQAAVQTRNRLYNLGVLKSHAAGAVVISVGNISAGGTGKTPFVIHLVERINGLPTTRAGKIAVLSRGYMGKAVDTHLVADSKHVRSTPGIAGDEPILIAESCPGTTVVVDKNRVRGARYAVEDQRAEIVILDDGFQHRRIERDLDIVLLNGQNPLGNRLLLPAGFLREPVASLSRADLIVLSKSIGSNDDLTDRAARLQELLQKPVISTRLVPRYWRRIGPSELLAAEQVQGRRVVAFAGIADPLSFFTTVESLGAEIVDSIPFADHCKYSKSHIDIIANRYVRNRAEWLVTTSKDAIKLPGILRHLPIFYLDTVVEIVTGFEVLDGLLTGVIRKKEDKENSEEST